jgi:hypothetical protein
MGRSGWQEMDRVGNGLACLPFGSAQRAGMRKEAEGSVGVLLMGSALGICGAVLFVSMLLYLKLFMCLFL